MRSVIVAVICVAVQLPAQGQRLHLEEAGRFGTVDDGPHAFHNIRALIVDADSIYVAQEFDIVVIGRGGLVLDTLGGAGAGPGEFRRIQNIGIAGDRLWAVEWASQRITWFVPGEKPTTTSLPVRVFEGSGRPIAPSAITRSGEIVAAPAPTSTVWASAESTRIPLMRFRPDATTVDTLSVLDASREIGRIMWPGRIRSWFTQPFQTGSLWDVSSSGEFVAVIHRILPLDGNRGSWVLEVHDLVGNRRVRKRFPYSAVPIPDEVVNEAIEPFLGDGRRHGLSPSEAERVVRENIFVPALAPPVGDLVVGYDGTVFVRKDYLRGAGPTAEWLILDRIGQEIGTFVAPDGLEIMDGGRDEVWGIERDELDVQYVVWYRLMHGE